MKFEDEMLERLGLFAICFIYMLIFLAGVGALAMGFSALFNGTLEAIVLILIGFACLMIDIVVMTIRS